MAKQTNILPASDKNISTPNASPKAKVDAKLRWSLSIVIIRKLSVTEEIDEDTTDK